jgi:hypothetical protein
MVMTSLMAIGVATIIINAYDLAYASSSGTSGSAYNSGSTITDAQLSHQVNPASVSQILDNIKACCLE